MLNQVNGLPPRVLDHVSIDTQSHSRITMAQLCLCNRTALKS